MSDQLARALKQSTLREAANIATLLEGGAELELDATAAVPSALLETYQTREQHLATLTTHHAQRLLRATQEFCAALSAASDEQKIGYARVDDTLLGSYIVWFDHDSFALLGCIYVIGKSEVEEQVWHSLWNDT